MNNDMDWKEMTEQPAEGTFEKIQRRLKVRRAFRIGLPAVAVVAALAVAAVALPGHETKVDDEAIAAVQVQNIVSIEEQVPAAADKAMTVATETDAKEDIDFARLMPVANPQVSQVQPPAELHTISVCSPLVWTSDENASHEVRDIVQQEAIDSLFVTVADDDKTDDSPLSALHPMLPSKAGEPDSEPYHEDDLLWAPNIITPGGDIDENRVFGIKSSSTLNQFVIHIYNRRGQRIFSSTDPAFEWDATYNGAAVQQGAFVWVASFRDSEGKARTETGTVVVVR